MAAPSRLTEDRLAEARRLRGQGMSTREIAVRMGMGKTRMAEILAGDPRLQREHVEPPASAAVHEPPSPRPAAPVAPPVPVDEGESPPVIEPAASLPPVESSSLPVDKLDQLRDLLERLPIRQQDRLVAGLKIDRVRMDAVGRALARHPEAARDVAQALRALEI